MHRKETKAVITWHSNGTVSGQNIGSRFTYYATMLLDAMREGRSINHIGEAEMMNAFDEDQKGGNDEGIRRRDRLAGKTSNRLPVYEILCECGEPATMECKTCDKDLCDTHDESQHPNGQSPPHIRMPKKPELNVMRSEVGKKVLYRADDGKEHMGQIRGLYIERVPNRQDKELAVLYFGPDDFMG